MRLFHRSESREVATREPAMIEKRDPTAATRSLRWVTPGRATPPDWDAEQAFRLGVYANVVVYACFQAIANAISALPFRAGADPDKPNDYDVKAPLARLLGPPPLGPNPGMSAEELWHFAIVQYLATGRFGWETEVNGSGTPIALWPLVSRALTPIPSASGVNWFQGFQYGTGNQIRNLTPDRIVYAWQPHGNDFRQPESALEAAHLDVSIAVMQSRYDYAFLKNDARPSAIVVTEAFEDQDSFDAFKGQFNSEFQGPNNAGKTAFVEASGTADKGVSGAIDVKVLGFSPKDAQAAQRYAERLQQIAIALGVPWSRLDASGRTFDNASQEDLIWWEQRLLPLLRRLQSAINMQLAPRLGDQVGWFDLSKVRALQLHVNPITAAVGAPSMVQAQLMTINEGRADYGLPALPDGDRMMTVEEITALRGTGTNVNAVRETPVRAEPPETRTPDVPEVKVLEDPEVRRVKVWTSTNQTVRNLERLWQRGMRRLFARQLTSTLARLEGKRGRAIAAKREIRTLADEIFDPEHWTVETADAVRVLYEQVTATAGARMADRFGIAFDLEAEFAQDFVTARANQLAGQVTDTTYAAIKDALAEGVNAGESIPELAGRVKDVFGTASESRALTIARTEVVSAFNGSSAAIASSYGDDVVAGQEWLATQDARTRESHSAIDGEAVRIGQRFSNGLAYPGDPSGDPAEVVNCRCTVVFLTPEEMTRTKPRRVPLQVARAVLRMVRVGEFDERWMRDALRAA